MLCNTFVSPLKRKLENLNNQVGNGDFFDKKYGFMEGKNFELVEKQGGKVQVELF